MVGDFAMTKCDPPPALVEGDFIGSAEAGTLWGANAGWTAPLFGSRH
jgi:hypothetical protein